MIEVSGVVGLVEKRYPHQVLVVSRNNYPLINTVSIPGGGVEEGESPERGVEREIKEETNIDVSFSGWLGNVKFLADHNLSILYDVKVAKCDYRGGSVKPGKDIRKAFWVSPHQIFGDSKLYDQIVAYPVRRFYSRLIESYESNTGNLIELDLLPKNLEMVEGLIPKYWVPTKTNARALSLGQDIYFNV